MALGCSYKRTHLNHLLRIGLVLALVFAAWHVTSHTIDTSSGVVSHDECQVCRLNHVPVGGLPILAWLVSLLVISRVAVISTRRRPSQSYRYTLGARAPPLY